MKSFEEFVNEAKQVGSLYHILNFAKFIYVVENNQLTGLNYSKISLTRNKMLNRYAGEGGATFLKFEIDGGKLSNNYKIQPVQYERGDGSFLKEFEEEVDGPIKNFFKYVTKLIVIEERMKNPLDRDKTILDFLKSSDIEKIKNGIDVLQTKYKIPIFIQRGTKIIKDDKYLEQINLLV